MSKPFRVNDEEEVLLKIMRAVEVPAEKVLSILGKESQVVAAMIKRERKGGAKPDVTKTI